MNDIANLVETTDEYRDRMGRTLPVDEDLADAIRGMLGTEK